MLGGERDDRGFGSSVAIGSGPDFDREGQVGSRASDEFLSGASPNEKSRSQKIYEWTEDFSQG